MSTTALHPDRLLPAEPATRAIARELYAGIASLPLVAVHGHVEPAVLFEDRRFGDPAELLVTSDHYVGRVLHSVGVPLDRLWGAARPEPRQVWRDFCAHWDAFRGSATRQWLEQELTELFDVELPLSEGTADAAYDAIAARLATDAFRPRALFARFDLELLSTTDAPGSTYAEHAGLQAAGLRVVPTLRPDTLTDATRADWVTSLERSGITSYAQLLGRLAEERRRSAEHGAVATDHGHATPDTEDLSDVEASAIFDRIVAGRAGPGDTQRLAGELLTQMAIMALDDGLVMQLHTGVQRDHDGPAKARYGSDIGGDFPVPVSFTRPLRALLERCGDETALRLVVFTVDETVYSRELAPMASYYPALYLGAPWWFLDAPDAMARHFAATVESAGYAKLSGFVDDTRAYCSIPARHDVARRSVAGHLARFVAEHRLSLADAAAVAADYAYHQPRAVYSI